MSLSSVPFFSLIFAVFPCESQHWSLSESDVVSKDGVGVMEHDKEANPEAPTYQNLLLLGAIAAASAFVVTILIVLVCVGCQR